MKNSVHPGAGAGAGRRVRQIRLQKFHRFEAGEIFPLASGKVVDAAHRFSPRQQRGGDRTADKSCSSRY
jgi:hypothetical protein